MNFYGSYLRDFDRTGYGGCLRDCSGSSVLSFAGLLASCSSNEAELCALWRGIQELDKAGSEEMLWREILKWLSVGLRVALAHGDCWQSGENQIFYQVPFVFCFACSESC